MGRTKRDEAKSRYCSWWRGKRCRLAQSSHPYRRVLNVNVYGPPSWGYGIAELVFEDGTRSTIAMRPIDRSVRHLASGSSRPSINDVEIEPPFRVWVQIWFVMKLAAE